MRTIAALAVVSLASAFGVAAADQVALGAVSSRAAAPSGELVELNAKIARFAPTAVTADTSTLSARDRQALILGREEGGQVRLRYLPVANLKETAAGRVSFDKVGWGAGLPLKLWEDARLDLPSGENREGWLSGWHTDLE